MLRERESAALIGAIPRDCRIATSVVAVVEVARAVRVANSADDVEADAEDLLDGCMLVDLDESVRRAAATLTSPALRPLDAIHLATALSIGPTTMLVYDRALGRTAARLGLRVEAPGAAL